MNEKSIELLNKLSFSEYKTFIRNALGLLYFNAYDYYDRHFVLSVKSKNGRTFKDAIAYLYFENNEKKNDEYEFVFFVNKTDYKNKVFRQNSTVEEIDSFFLDDKLSESDLFFLLLVSFEGSDSTLYYKKTDLTLKTKQDIKNIDIYSFILGSGIDYDYGIDKWSDLIRIIEIKTNALSGVSVEDLKGFSNKRCNTNYYTPQILKDIDDNVYFDVIKEFLYRSFKEKDTDDRKAPEIVDRNLYQVCRIVYTQTELTDNQTLLTFNYDDIVEQTLKNSFKYHVESSYKFSNKELGKIIVEHSHGLLPFKGVTDNHKRSIVLSHDEYLSNYSTSRSYSYSKLYAQLRKRNLIIGNSVADYEEQKVFYNHHKMYLNEFSYALLIKEKIDWLNYYTVVSLYRIGIIPIFFEDYNEMCNYLKTIRSSLDVE